MALMTTAPRETCSHESCDMEPCSFYDFIEYAFDSVWGFGSTCESCEGFFPGTLPEDHVEQRHEDLN
jgi:hypothetical protein